MPKTRPFSDLLGPIMADPARRAEMAALKREMEAALADAQRQDQPSEPDVVEGQEADVEQH